MTPDRQSEEMQSQGSAAPKKPRTRNIDWFSSLSFLTAGVFGLATIANTIRYKFYHNFVLGFGETNTPFTPIIREYTGDPKQNGKDGKFAAIVAEYNDGKGKMTPAEYAKKMRDTATEMRLKIDKKVLKDFGIPYTPIKSWTIGTFKRFQHLGFNARKEATLGFAAVTAIGLGAVSILRQSKHTLDRVEDRLDAIEQHHAR